MKLNYVTVFVLHHTQMVLKPHKIDEFTTIEEEKYLEKDSVNFTITMCHWSHVISYMASNNDILLFLYGN